MSTLQKAFTALLVGVLSFGPAIAWADTEVTTSNSSDDVEAESGDSHASNSSAAQVGHSGEGDSDVEAEDVDNQSATNVQEGDNELEGSQSARSETGGAVTGQVVGAVSDGALTIDATNASLDTEALTGDATTSNDFAAFVGLTAGSDTAITADILNGNAVNVQEGDNSADVTQSSDAVTGDAVAGQILGATSTGPTDIVAANTSEDSETTSGDSDEDSISEIFTGMAAAGFIEI